MKRSSLLKQLLPGLLPILVYIAADEYWGTKVGIIIAILFSLLFLIYFYIKERRIDKFIIVDALLLVVFGSISIVLDNDIFFKLKPAFIELIMVAVLGVSAFSTKNLMLKMSQRYIKDIEINEAAQNKIKQNSKVLFYIFLSHSLLIVYAAYLLSDKAWAFISTALFYILMGLYFIFEFIRIKIQNRKN